MLIYSILFLGSCLLALIITPLLRWLAVKNGALDYPNERKIHKEAVPRIGGVAMVISFFIPTILSYIFYRSKMQESMMRLIGLSIGALIITALGIRDDLHGMNARKKLIGQAAAVLALMPFGFVIHGFSIPFVTHFIEFRWELGIPLTLFWIIGIVNTINFIDGMDGLAAGVSITISSALFIMAVVNQQFFMAALCLILAGSTLGFLRYNFHPATIFMGDCGAMFLGFMLAAISVEVLFHNQSITASSLVPALIFGLPVVDSSWAIMRRIRKRSSPFHADNLHTHHRLINLGFTQRKAVVILYITSLLSIIVGVVIALAGNDELAVILSALMLFVALAGVILLNRASPANKFPEQGQVENVPLSNPE